MLQATGSNPSLDITIELITTELVNCLTCSNQTNYFFVSDKDSSSKNQVLACDTLSYNGCLFAIIKEKSELLTSELISMTLTFQLQVWYMHLCTTHYLNDANISTKLTENPLLNVLTPLISTTYMGITLKTCIHAHTQIPHCDNYVQLLTSGLDRYRLSPIAQMAY